MANEIRLRRNNISGTTTDNPLLIGATTINSPGFVDLPVVDTTNHLLLILDPLEVNGAAEIVQVTAHTAASSVCTIIRGFDSTTPRQHGLGTTWFHGPVASDYISSLPADASQAWAPFTTTITQGVGVTFTNTYSAYLKIGRQVTWSYFLNITSSGTAGQSIILTLPFTATGVGAGTPLEVGRNFLFDSSAALGYAGNAIVFPTTSQLSFRGGYSSTEAVQVLGVAGSGFALAVASGDQLSGTVIYQATT